MAMNLKTVLVVSIVLRVVLICWGELQDRWLDVKYTDIDYSVFTDAARFVAQGKSPFLRSTYRYSPLLAYILLPNIWITRVWGKVLFAGADIVVAWQLWRLGQLQGASESRCLWSMLLWLYNPFTVTISTRGSCDSLVTLLLLATMLLLLQGQRVLPALLYGLAVHFRIFPIVYAPAIVMYLAQRRLQQQQGAEKQLASRGSRKGPGQQRPHGAVQQAASWVAAVLQEGLVFGGISGSLFIVLGLVFYHLYGHSFLHEAYLHHTIRKDPRHNFSVYYYPIYLDFMAWPGQQSATAATAAADGGGIPGGAAALPQLLYKLGPVDVNRYAAIPQLTLLLVLSVTLHRHLPLCLLMQTWAFVAFNKVSTAQYFVWYLSFLPIALQRAPWPAPKGLQAAGAAWVATQLHWLLWGYLLEFEGRGVHLWLWVAGLVFLAVNAACMCVLMQCGGGSMGAAGSPTGHQHDRLTWGHGNSVGLQKPTKAE